MKPIAICVRSVFLCALLPVLLLALLWPAQALGEGCDAIIGPAVDGGYYLIGVRESDLEVFSGIRWGSGQVLAATLEKFRDLGWRWRELATRRDVDRPADLAALADFLIY